MDTFQSLSLQGKKVLVRLDLNCPLKKGRVEDDFRIQSALPTIRKLQEMGARVILMSHLGRPKGAYKEDLSLRPVQKRLEELLGISIPLAPSVVGGGAENMVQSLGNGQVGILENLRFEKGEEENSPDFSKALAALGEVYVNDAFGCSHRKHASVYGITDYLPSYFGLLVEKEILYYEKIKNPERPFYVVLGGAKVKTKLPVIANLIHKADRILIGGAMTYTFLKAQGMEVGSSLVEPEYLPECQQLLETYGSKIELPQDHIVASALEEGSSIDLVRQIPPGKIALDLGLATVSYYCRLLEEGKTVVWNGPLGAFEISAFGYGTHSLALKMAFLRRATTITGGGDIVAALRKFGVLEHFSFVSTGGGAFLDLLGGKQLPGIEAIIKKNK